ncbi:MAG: hypothetical protein GXY13_01225 [Acidimicrobiales bacterium]|nr:hypothetical protein [Acidimicrobiales bacterium]
MFPLGTVLLPGTPLALHVFEPRYREMVRTCLDGDRSFGVVMIERGSEVGGGDVRSDVGTRAHLVEVAATPDGRYRLLAVGGERLRVLRWLDDDPHPWAEVEAWPDPPVADADAHRGALDEVTARLDRVRALQVDLGEPPAPVPATTDGGLTPEAATHRLAACLPVGPFDRQRLLASPDGASRLALAVRLLDDLTAELEARADLA